MKAIITFHSIDDSGSVLSFPQAALDKLITGILESGLPIMNLDSLLSQQCHKGVALTFDDGIRSLYSNGLPVLQQYAVPAHLFLTTGSIGKNNRWPTQPAGAPGFDMLNWDEIEQLHAAGITIEAHTHSHPDMRELTDEQMQQECEQADTLIEQRVGCRPRYFAYPYGYRNTRVSEFARRRYDASVTTTMATLSGSNDVANLPRLDSYYLQSPWLLNRPGSVAARSYYRLRSVLRSLRGTQ